MTGTASSQGGQFAAISETYAAALAAAPDLHMIADKTAPPSQCSGTAADPQAAPGNLCVYESPNHGNLIEAPQLFIDPLTRAGNKRTQHDFPSPQYGPRASQGG